MIQILSAFFQWFVRLGVVYLILAFERVNGLPILFVALCLYWLNTVQGQGRVALIIMLGLGLGSAYTINYGWAVGIIWFAYLSFHYLRLVIVWPTARFMIVSLLIALLVGFLSGWWWHPRVFLYAVISLSLVVVASKRLFVMPSWSQE